jgi:hypothetical protein
MGGSMDDFIPGFYKLLSQLSEITQYVEQSESFGNPARAPAG